jgi:trehalose 6-phosphate synthase/phosphatase
VAFIAPLRDGMNLAAKEFIASRRKDGVLILSETAGAAQELQDALLVNPKRPEELVDALQQALTMKRRELRGRLRRMQLQLSTNTVQEWTKDFVAALQQPATGNRLITRALKGRFETNLLDHYQQAKKRLLLLDYDGSLVPFSANYQAVKPPKTLLKLLLDLANDTRNSVVLISGRSADELQEWFGQLPINLVAEHGAAIRKANSQTWQTIEKVDTRWKQILEPALQKYADLTPGARVEVKPHSLVWHYRAAAPYYAQKYAVVIKSALKPVLKTYGLELLQGNKVLEIKNPRVSKGMVARRWLRHNHDFILAIGDDVTDEELFAILPEPAYRIKVGRGRSTAGFRLLTPEDLLDLLRAFIKTQ